VNTQADAVPGSGAEPQAVAPAAMAATRPLYWSVRRELWENRSIHIAPLAVAAVFMLGFLISTIHLAEKVRAALALDAAQQQAHLARPYSVLAILLILNAFAVAVFYCLDALHGERRDRSILFWKSLPVSDLVTVLSKAAIPLVVLPLLTFAIIVATQLVMRVLSVAVLYANGLSSEPLRTQVPLLQMSLVLLYGLTVQALWYAPVYGWLLLVSAWARRSTFLWAVLPLLGICVVEKIAFNTSHFASMLGRRLTGGFAGAFDGVKATNGVPIVSLTQLAPGKFLSGPGLWIGLVAAVALLLAAARLRRYREPN
jgi:ABC-2 type transport system permease protein